MPTLKAILNEFVDQTQIGLKGTGTFAAQTVTDTTELQNTNYQGNEYLNWWLSQIDSATAADQAKPVGTNGLAPTTGVLTQVGSAFATTGASLSYLLTRPEWHPVRYLIPLANRALQKAWSWWRSPISLVADGDFEGATITTNWTGTSATPTYETTIVWGGKASGKVANSGANGYIQSAAIEVAPLRAFRITAKVRATTGIPVMTLIDLSHSNAVIATVTATSPTGAAAWEDIMLPGSLPDGCFRVALRLGSAGASDVTYWDDVTLYYDQMTSLAGPSWFTQWRTEDGDEAARLYYARNRLGSTGDWKAQAYDLALVDPADFQVIQQPSAVQPLMFEFGRRPMSFALWPLILEARRPFSDFGTLTLGTSSTSCPLRLVVAAMKLLAANERNLPHRSTDFGGDGLWEHEFVREQRRVASMLNEPVADSYGMRWATLG